MTTRPSMSFMHQPSIKKFPPLFGSVALKYPTRAEQGTATTSLLRGVIHPVVLILYFRRWVDPAYDSILTQPEGEQVRTEYSKGR